MENRKAYLSHVVLRCFDFEMMLDFYRNVLGFHLTDRGEAYGNRICFLTFDPVFDHHQLALSSGRTGPRDGDVGSVLNHVAFRVGSLAELRARYESLTAAGVSGIQPISHASWFSVYYRDPENNRLEFFWDTPYYVDQPVIEPLEITRSDEEIMQMLLDKHGKHPSFRPMSQWKAEAAKTFS